MINQYRVEKTLGSGSFAEVLLCKDTKTNIQYAIKQMSKKWLKKQRVYESVKEELAVL